MGTYDKLINCRLKNGADAPNKDIIGRPAPTKSNATQMKTDSQMILKNNYPYNDILKCTQNIVNNYLPIYKLILLMRLAEYETTY